jgi:hypothetical protein
MRTNIRAREEDSSQTIDACVRATHHCVCPKPHGHHKHLKFRILITYTMAYFLTDPLKINGELIPYFKTSRGN